MEAKSVAANNHSEKLTKIREKNLEKIESKYAYYALPRSPYLFYF